MDNACSGKSRTGDESGCASRYNPYVLSCSLPQRIGENEPLDGYSSEGSPSRFRWSGQSARQDSVARHGQSSRAGSSRRASRKTARCSSAASASGGAGTTGSSRLGTGSATCRSGDWGTTSRGTTSRSSGSTGQTWCACAAASSRARSTFASGRCTGSGKAACRSGSSPAAQTCSARFRCASGAQTGTAGFWCPSCASSACEARPWRASSSSDGAVTSQRDRFECGLCCPRFRCATGAQTGTAGLRRPSCARFGISPGSRFRFTSGSRFRFASCTWSRVSGIPERQRFEFPAFGYHGRVSNAAPQGPRAFRDAPFRDGGRVGRSSQAFGTA
jgi:hypothetical protein